jgi:diguanylate cyclase (GGDEF)-like protein
MSVLERRNAPLLAGLATAVVLVLVPPFPQALAALRALEDRLGFHALPAVAAVLIGWLVYWMGQRHQRQTQAAIADVTRREALRRGSEIQRLVAFGHAVARALDYEAMREAINKHLPLVTGATRVWVLIRQGPRWELLAGEADAKGMADRVEFAESILSGQRPGVTRDYRAAFPMVVGGVAVGVIGIDAAGPIDEERERNIEAAASLIAVSLKNVQLFHDARETGVRDGLTGCWTRTHALDVLDSELRRARRSRLPLSILLFDLDHFKAINDRFGHLCGDAVLAEVGRRFHEVLRTSDLKCRYGGEEFLGVLPATPLHGAGCVAETLRREIADRPIAWGGEVVSITASIGVTQAEPGELDIDAIIARADAALYRAKQRGRDRVSLEPETAPVADSRKPDVPA